MTAATRRHRYLLIALLAWALAMIVPDLLRVVQPLGSYGLSANNDGLIYDVMKPFDVGVQSPAWQAGIRDGDRLDLSRLDCFPYADTTCGTRSRCSAGASSCCRGAKRRSSFKATSEHQRGRSP